MTLHATDTAQWHKMRELNVNLGTIYLYVKFRLHGAFSMCVSMSDKPVDTELCYIGGQASATNGLSDMKSYQKRNQPLNASGQVGHTLVTIRSPKSSNAGPGYTWMGDQIRITLVLLECVSTSWVLRPSLSPGFTYRLT
jgi:hypothetical protein